MTGINKVQRQYSRVKKRLLWQLRNLRKL